MTKQLDDIERAVKSGNLADLRAVSHKTKGTCGTFGATPMARIAEALQMLAESGTTAGAESMVVALRHQFGLVKEALAKELAKT